MARLSARDPELTHFRFDVASPMLTENPPFAMAARGDTLLVVCNLGAATHDLAELLPEAPAAEVVLGNLPEDDPATLRPWEARVLRP